MSAVGDVVEAAGVSGGLQGLIGLGPERAQGRRSGLGLGGGGGSRGRGRTRGTTATGTSS